MGIDEGLDGTGELLGPLDLTQGSSRQEGRPCEAGGSGKVVRRIEQRRRRRDQRRWTYLESRHSVPSELAVLRGCDGKTGAVVPAASLAGYGMIGAMGAITGAVHPTPAWTIQRWTEVFSRQAALIRAAISETDPRSPVPTTAGWTFRDLALHVGRFAEQVTKYLTSGSILMLPPPPLPEGDPIEYLDLQLAALEQALRTTAANRPVWTMSPAAPDLAWVWHRRAAHELNLRRWEAQAALRKLEPTDRDLAVDGIDETLTSLLGAKYGTEIPVEVTGTLLVSANDGPEAWHITFTPAEIPATQPASRDDESDARLESTASNLHYHLRNRTALDGTGNSALLRAAVVE